MIDIERALRWMAVEDRTVAYLAKQCGVDEEQLVFALAGRAEPDADLVSALERAMGLTEGELLEDQADTAPGSDAVHLRCFTIEEVATRMRVHPDTVHKEIRVGRLRHILVGERGIRIPYVALEERLSLTE